MIDALDECRDSDGTRRKILSKLRHLQAEGDVRLMVTSRFFLEIVDEFRGALDLEVRASNEDVKRFIAGQTYRLPVCIQRDLALRDLVQEKIVEVVDGMYVSSSVLSNNTHSITLGSFSLAYTQTRF